MYAILILYMCACAYVHIHLRMQYTNVHMRSRVSWLKPVWACLYTDTFSPDYQGQNAYAYSHAILCEASLFLTLVLRTVILLIDPANPEELQTAKSFCKRLAHRAISMGGTCTGEHGIGYGKLEFLVEEHGSTAVSVFQALKDSMDPKHLLNPGKLGDTQPLGPWGHLSSGIVSLFVIRVLVVSRFL